MSQNPAPADERGFGEGWLIRRPAERERRWFLLHGLIRGLFWLIPFVVVALIWIYWFEVSFFDRYPVGIVLAGLAILIEQIAWGLIFPKNWLVSIGPQEVMIQRGIIQLARIFVAYDRVQQVDSISTPVMSNLNLTELVLHSAAGGVRVYALDPEDARMIRERVHAGQPLPSSAEL